ncbi:MAG: nickel-type superoxide dismutase maturation protease [Pyrinomonadaceae bacterium]|nr:nickel-type superoxide dismutase maturation protease [Pyrinomonadaceae bacterium]MBP6213736.1 nickel-type superoxide dismutase maturation protease [Pyrinomonadaceae bacterium]
MKYELRKADWKDKVRLYFGFPARLFALKVAGNSMSPAINDRDIVLYERTKIVASGDIILVSHPYMQSVKIVKRVVTIEHDGRLTLAGDNQVESTDSRTFGTVSLESIIGKVTSKLK